MNVSIPDFDRDYVVRTASQLRAGDSFRLIFNFHNHREASFKTPVMRLSRSLYHVISLSYTNRYGPGYIKVRAVINGEMDDDYLIRSRKIAIPRKH